MSDNQIVIQRTQIKKLSVFCRFPTNLHLQHIIVAIILRN